MFLARQPKWHLARFRTMHAYLKKKKVPWMELAACFNWRRCNCSSHTIRLPSNSTATLVFILRNCNAVDSSTTHKSWNLFYNNQAIAKWILRYTTRLAPFYYTLDFSYLLSPKNPFYFLFFVLFTIPKKPFLLFLLFSFYYFTIRRRRGNRDSEVILYNWK